MFFLLPAPLLALCCPVFYYWGRPAVVPTSWVNHKPDLMQGWWSMAGQCELFQVSFSAELETWNSSLSHYSCLVFLATLYWEGQFRRERRQIQTQIHWAEFFSWIWMFRLQLWQLLLAVSVSSGSSVVWWTVCFTTKATKCSL